MFKKLRRRYWKLKGQYRKWKKRDQRPKSNHAYTKYAINRDGDLFLVECPQCGNQVTKWIESERHFCCFMNDCWIAFRVDTEDGVIKLFDHREGNIALSKTIAYDPAGQWRIGIYDDAIWWWDKRTLYRDLQPSGRDAHDHGKYEILGRVSNYGGKVKEDEYFTVGAEYGADTTEANP